MGCKDTRCRFINSIKTDCHYSWSSISTPRIMVDKKRLYREEDNSGIRPRLCFLMKIIILQQDLQWGNDR